MDKGGGGGRAGTISILDLSPRYGLPYISPGDEYCDDYGDSDGDDDDEWKYAVDDTHV